MLFSLFFPLNYCFAAVVLIATNKVEYIKLFFLDTEVLARLSVWSEVQIICTCPADATPSPSSLASLKSTPEWFHLSDGWLTHVVPEKRPLNTCLHYYFSFGSVRQIKLALSAIGRV